MEQKYYAIISWSPGEGGDLGRFVEIFFDEAYALAVLHVMEAYNVFSAYTVEEWSLGKGWPWPFRDDTINYLFKPTKTNE